MTVYLQLICSNSLTQFAVELTSLKMEMAGQSPCCRLLNILMLDGCLSWKGAQGSSINLCATAFETTEGPQVQADEAEPQDKAFRIQHEEPTRCDSFSFCPCQVQPVVQGRHYLCYHGRDGSVGVVNYISSMILQEGCFLLARVLCPQYTRSR